MPAFSNVMDTKDIQTSAYFKLPPGARRPPGAGAVAHMSLHLINNVKEPPTNTGGQPSIPPSQRGGVCPSYVATVADTPELSEARRCGVTPYMDHPPYRQTYSEFILSYQCKWLILWFYYPTFST